MIQLCKFLENAENQQNVKSTPYTVEEDMALASTDKPEMQNKQYTHDIYKFNKIEPIRLNLHMVVAEEVAVDLMTASDCRVLRLSERISIGKQSRRKLLNKLAERFLLRPLQFLQSNGQLEVKDFEFE